MREGFSGGGRSVATSEGPSVPTLAMAPDDNGVGSAKSLKAKSLPLTRDFRQTKAWRRWRSNYFGQDDYFRRRRKEAVWAPGSLEVQCSMFDALASRLSGVRRSRRRGTGKIIIGAKSLRRRRDFGQDNFGQDDSFPRQKKETVWAPRSLEVRRSMFKTAKPSPSVWSPRALKVQCSTFDVRRSTFKKGFPLCPADQA